MKPKTKPLADVGVIVGRFQVDELHDGHMDLINSVCERHSKVIIFLGLSQARCTIRNPLDFEARKQMILEKFPEVNVLYIKDTVCDKIWSKQLDSQIDDIVGPNQSVMLYGGRDAFIKHYQGKHKCTEMEQKVYISGESIRKEISNKVKASSDFRKGVIWAVHNQYIKCIPTVDIAIIDDNNNLLLGRKPHETKYRFIGGFVSAGETFETAAKREVAEETHLEIEIVKNLGSYVVDDWRYKNEKDKITTTLFIAKKVFGRPEADDDIIELRWFDINELRNVDLNHMLVSPHVLMLSEVLKNL